MQDHPVGVSFREALSVWAKIGFLSFGGPAGQIALMHRMLVEERKWIGNERFLHALNYCHLLPGPEAQQLAAYVGWLLHGVRGGLAAGILFIIPGMLAILGLSFLYAGYRQVPAVQALFYGLKPAVLAIVVAAVLRIAQKALKTPYMVGIAAAAFIAIFFFQTPFPLVVLGAAILGYLGREACPDLLQNACPSWIAGAAPSDSGTEEEGLADSLLAAGSPARYEPSLVKSLKTLATWLLIWLSPVAVLLLALGPDNVYSKISIFFSKMAVVTFGGAYAVLAYMAQEAVAHYGWLNAGEMLDGLALAETTPGPLIQVVQYVGFLAAYRSPGPLNAYLAGTLGAALTVWVTFAPCFLWIFLGAPYVEKLRGNRAASGALSGITAAVTGVVLNLSIWFGIHALFKETTRVAAFGAAIPIPVPSTADWFGLTLAGISFIALKRWNVGVVPILLACAVLGYLRQILV